MALPVAHLSVALGAGSWRRRAVLLQVALVAVAADFDFALVWGLDLPAQTWHRTFSHSLAAAALLAAAAWAFRPGWLRLSPRAVFAVYLSHPLLDMLCTADAADHGVMLLWPLSFERFGWAVLVPIYRLFAESPFSAAGALRFTLLEVLLAAPLWVSGRMLLRPMLTREDSGGGADQFSGRPAAVSGSSSTQSGSGRGRSRGAISSSVSAS